MRFRPCIDLHNGVVKQIVGASLGEGNEPATNFVSDRSASHYAQLYRDDGLSGGHMIMLGPGNETAAAAALAAFPNGLQIGGGIDRSNAQSWLERGAAQIIVTSYLFVDGRFRQDRLEELASEVGSHNLVVDLSCARSGDTFVAMTDRWQRRTDLDITEANLTMLSEFCSQFLVHATEVEGTQMGIATDVVKLLGEIAPIATTYAGGIRSFEEIERIGELAQDRLDFTVGSALDIFGGTGIRYRELVAFNRDQASQNS
jgi:phosphoribosylformimino-5-aminoimidazole carboxamide ribotide isomerase